MPQTQLQIALANDEEAAERYLETAEKRSGMVDITEGAKRPSLETWSPEVQHLAIIADRLSEVVAAIISTVPGQKPPKVKPLPRPETAIDRVRRRRAWRRHDELVAEVEEAQRRWAAKRGLA